MNLSFRLLERSALLLTTMAFACHVAQPGQAPATPNLEEQVRTEEAVCIVNLRTINAAQIAYQGGDETKGFARSLRELGPAGAGILEQGISAGMKSGYRFRLVPEPTAANQPPTHLLKHRTNNDDWVGCGWAPVRGDTGWERQATGFVR